MRLRPSAGRADRWSLVALLLALMLPWQAFAADAHCELASTLSHSGAPHEHCAEHLQHAPNPPHGSPQHHGCCADCCLAAVVSASFEWRTPSAVAPESYLPAPSAPLTIALDRLDRPPRLRA